MIYIVNKRKFRKRICAFSYVKKIYGNIDINYTAIKKNGKPSNHELKKYYVLIEYLKEKKLDIKFISQIYKLYNDTTKRDHVVDRMLEIYYKYKKRTSIKYLYSRAKRDIDGKDDYITYLNTGFTQKTGVAKNHDKFIINEKSFENLSDLKLDILRTLGNENGNLFIDYHLADKRKLSNKYKLSDSNIRKRIQRSKEKLTCLHI